MPEMNSLLREFNIWLRLQMAGMVGPTDWEWGHADAASWTHASSAPQPACQEKQTTYETPPESPCSTKNTQKQLQHQ